MVHQFQNNGYNIVLDVESGSIHVVDDIAYDVIRFIIEYEKLNQIQFKTNTNGLTKIQNKEKILDDLISFFSPQYHVEELKVVLENINELIEAGQLFTPDIFKGINVGNISSTCEQGMLPPNSWQVDSENGKNLTVENLLQHKRVVKALCMHIAHDCNLACKYCFANEGEYQGKRELMSFDVGKKALDFLIANSGNRRNLEVDFFGGEPLMNWQVIKELVIYAREQEKNHQKKFRFTLTTNGVLLDDEITDFANREMDNVVLSLDGRKEINDKMRPFRNGKGSYEQIVPKLQRFAKSRGEKDYFIRGTFTRENLDFVKDIKHFVELGFDKISIEPVVGDDKDIYAIKKEDLPRIFDEYDYLAKEMAKLQGAHEGENAKNTFTPSKKFTFFHFLLDLEGGPCVAKRLSGCGAGTEYLAVTPSGDLYPCHQFVGEEEFLLGNVDQGILKPKLQEEFNRCNIYSKEECKKCFAKFYCSGGCMANSYQFHKNINDIYEIACEMERKRVECAMMLMAAWHEKKEREEIDSK